MLPVEPEIKQGGALRVGMIWGGIGGVVGFLVSLLGSLAGLVAAAFIGLSCGRRAAEAERGRKRGAVAGLVSGVMAAPVFVLGASAGALAAARQIGSASMAQSLSDWMGMEVSAEQAWDLFLLSVAFFALLQAAVLIGVSAAAGAWAGRRGGPQPP
jgi:hypothetical protein